MPVRNGDFVGRLAVVERKGPTRLATSACPSKPPFPPPSPTQAANDAAPVWLAHRLPWTGAHGLIPKDEIPCHRRDERRWVNPDYLILGTRHVYMDDLNARQLRRSGA